MRPNNDLEQQLKLLGNALRARPRLTDRVMKKLVAIPGEFFEPVSIHGTTERVGVLKTLRTQVQLGSGRHWRWLVVTAVCAGLLMLILLALSVRNRDNPPPKSPKPSETWENTNGIRSGPAPG